VHMAHITLPFLSPLSTSRITQGCPAKVSSPESGRKRSLSARMGSCRPVSEVHKMAEEGGQTYI
jgi:hypothetical protein